MYCYKTEVINIFEYVLFLKYRYLFVLFFYNNFLNI